MTKSLENVKTLYHQAQNPPSVNTIATAKSKISSIFKKYSSLSKEEVTEKLSKKMEIPKHEAADVIEYLMYRDFFCFDWNIPICDATKLRIRHAYDPPLEPVYKLKPVPSPPKPEPLISINTGKKDMDVDNRDLASIPREDWEIAELRYESIEPLKDKYLQNTLSLREVKERSEELRNPKGSRDRFKNIGVSVAALYNCLKNLRNDGKLGLLPRVRFKGNRKPRLSVKQEKLMEMVIKEEYFKRGSRKTKKGCLIILNEHCLNSNQNTISYPTFDIRIERSPRQEIMGTQNIGIRNGISRALMGGKYEPKRPLELIYIDYTILDISLVDPLYGKPIGRPYLIVAIDAYSRMVFGYLLTLEDISSVEIGTAIVRGILPKDQDGIIEKYGNGIQSDWKIYGKPEKLKWDNGTTFDSKLLEEFCGIHGILNEFIKVRRADMNGMVERFIRTINEKIGSEDLPGYAAPLKQRPDGSDPDRKAAITYETLEKWLLSYFNTYHKTKHDSLGMSPLQKYQEGLQGREPILPKNPNRLWFEILPSIKRKVLQPYGIRLFGLNYNGEELTDARKSNSNDGKEIIRYDPRDVRWVYWYNKSIEDYVPIEMVGAVLAGLIPTGDEISVPLSRKELQKIKKGFLKDHKTVSAFDVARARKERTAAVLEDAKKSKRGRREIAKMEYAIDNPHRPKHPKKKRGIIKINKEDLNKNITPAETFVWTKEDREVTEHGS